MPKLELGDLDSIAKFKDANVPRWQRKSMQARDIVRRSVLHAHVQAGDYRCYPEDQQVLKVQQAMFDPFEYLWARHKAGLMRTDRPDRQGQLSRGR